MAKLSILLAFEFESAEAYQLNVSLFDGNREFLTTTIVSGIEIRDSRLTTSVVLREDTSIGMMQVRSVHMINLHQRS